MSVNATKTTTSEKRASQYKRKPPPSSTLVDLELGDAHDRYPPFDLDDPFASLTELRRRSRSYSCAFQCSTDLHHAAGTAPFDLPPLSAKAFPSETQRRYTLTVALPSPLASPGADVSQSDGRGGDYNNAVERENALAKLTTRASSAELNTIDKDAVSSRSRDASAGRTSHHDHHRRYAHISMLFRAASSAHLPQNGRTTQLTRSHYIPRKASSLSYMYTPPLTPDLSGTSSGTSSSSSSLLDPTMVPSNDKDVAPPPPKSPTPSAQSFVKKLLTKRSANVLMPIPWRNESMDAKDLPSLPPSPTPDAKRDTNNAPSIPFPRASALASMSDVTLPTTTSYSEKHQTTASIIGASPQPSVIFPRTSPSERESDGYATAPESRPPSGAELDAGLRPPSKNRLFSFSSRSLLRSRVDLYESSDESSRKSNVNVPDAPKASFDEYALPTPKQLLTASSMSVVSESGVRVRFGDIWENEKTVVIFIRHFRASACQDYIRSIASEVDVEALEKAGLKIVIVGMGSPSLIPPYRQLTGTNFPIYTDPTLAVHRALGMSLRSTDRGPAAERGHYIVPRGGALGTLRRTFAGAPRLPLFERAGDTAQLGGEFILGPGPSTCTFAHRMRTTRAHAPILDVVEASGVQTARTKHVLGMGGGVSARRESMEDEDAWMARRRRSLVRLRRKRQRRRVGVETVAVSVDAAKAHRDTGDRVLDVKRRERFPVVEEEGDEDGDEVYDVTLGTQ